jgi:hypothetical protein
MRKGTNTTKKQMEIARNAGKVHPWPDEAGECSTEAWEIYVKNQDFRAYADWFPGDLIELARVSRFQSMVVKETDALEKEGLLVLGGATGTIKVANPRVRTVNSLSATIMTMMRRMGITVMVTGDKINRAARAAKEREVESKIPKIDKSRSATADDFLWSRQDVAGLAQGSGRQADDRGKDHRVCGNLSSRTGRSGCW